MEPISIPNCPMHFSTPGNHDLVASSASRRLGRGPREPGDCPRELLATAAQLARGSSPSHMSPLYSKPPYSGTRFAGPPERVPAASRHAHQTIRRPGSLKITASCCDSRLSHPSRRLLCRPRAPAISAPGAFGIPRASRPAQAQMSRGEVQRPVREPARLAHFGWRVSRLSRVS